MIHNTSDPLAELSMLTRIDLNLLLAFDALARERSVTRAARRMGVTQSAMSHTLRRLRELLDDPLMIRSRGGMALTPRAEALAAPLRSGLVALERALTQPVDFDPATARRAFRIASLDLFDALTLPPLLERIRHDAPGIDLTIIPTGGRQLEEHLESGEVDLAVSAVLQGPLKAMDDLVGPGLQRRAMIRDAFVCMVRAGHPVLSEPALTLPTFTAMSHALVSPSGSGPGLMDLLLSEQGLSRRIALRLPHFHAAPAIIAQSDLILTAPRALLALDSGHAPLVALDPPLPMPEHTINLVWHQRFSEDPGHRWLRDLLADVAGKVRPEPRGTKSTDGE